MENAKQLLERKGKSFAGYDELSPSVIHFICAIMDEYANQFRQPVTELNERNSVDEATKSFFCDIENDGQGKRCWWQCEECSAVEEE